MKGHWVRQSACVVLALLAISSTPLDDVRFEGWGRELLAIPDRAPYYLTHEALAGLPVDAPPSNSSAETRSELDELLRLQSVRTRAEETAIAGHVDYHPLLAAFFTVVHHDLGACPKTVALLDHVDHDAMIAVFTAKRRFERPRPSRLEPRLHPSVAVPPHPAYPSGHALQGYLAARVLSDIFPEDAAALVTLGEQIGHEREVAGLHYASDSAASRKLGAALYAKLAENPTFTRELEAARRER